MSAVNADSVAQDQIKAFVERILRLREEVKAINGDIREVYAEAKGNGFDKAVLGKLVLYVEKRAANSAEMAEQDAIFDLYLRAYYDLSHVHAGARVREDEPEHDADGVIIETHAGAYARAHLNPGAKNVDHRPVHVPEEPGRGISSVSTPAEGSTISASIAEPGQVPDTSDEGGIGPSLLVATQSRLAETQLRSVSEPRGDEALAPILESDAEAGFSPFTADGAPATLVTRVADESVTSREAFQAALPATHLDRSKPHPDCQDPVDCGPLASWENMCGACLRARAKRAVEHYTAVPV